MFDFFTMCRVSNRSKSYSGFVGLFCLTTAAAFILVLGDASVETFGQDISGGAGEGVKRPLESSPRRRPKSTTQSKSTKRTTKSTAGATTTSQARIDLSKQVDSALELGNSARDSNPPRFADAEQAYKLALGLDPEEERAYVGLGNTYFDQKRYPEAEAAFVRAIELDPQDVDALVALAYTLNVQERYQEAERSALRAIGLDATNHTAYVALGWSKFRRKSYAEAETAYRRAIAISPKSPELYNELAVILMEEARWSDSEIILRQAVALDPANAGALGNYGVALHKLGHLDKAAESYAQAIKLDPNTSSPHSNLALVLYTRGDLLRAREEWDTALRLKSVYGPDRAGLLILDRKFGEAQIELEKHTQANPLDEDGWLLLGDTRRMQKDSAGASAAYSRAAQIAPDYAKHVRPTIPEPAAVKPAPVVKSDKKASTSAPDKAANHPAEVAVQPGDATLGPKALYASAVRVVKPTGYARPTPASGAISVRSNPNAIVLVEPMGGGEGQSSIVPTSITVVGFSQLKPGEYRVAAVLDGFEPLETRVFVAATRIISIRLIMRPKS